MLHIESFISKQCACLAQAFQLCFWATLPPFQVLKETIIILPILKSFVVLLFTGKVSPLFGVTLQHTNV